MLLAAWRAEKERQKATSNGLAVFSYQSGTKAAVGGWDAAMGS
jgi:hypothetical protein